MWHALCTVDRAAGNRAFPPCRPFANVTWAPLPPGALSFGSGSLAMCALENEGQCGCCTMPKPITAILTGSKAGILEHRERSGDFGRTERETHTPFVRFRGDPTSSKF